MELTHMDYVVSALASAHHDGVTLEELIRISVDCNTAQEFDARVDHFTDFTREPEEGVTVIELPV